MARTARKKIAVYAGGILVSDDIDSLDFEGDGVSTTVLGNAITATIPGGGGSGHTEVFAENLTTQGPGTSFTLAHTPVTGTVRLYRGGSRQAVAASDYSISGTGITLASALVAGEILIADYEY